MEVYQNIKDILTTPSTAIFKMKHNKESLDSNIFVSIILNALKKALNSTLENTEFDPAEAIEGKNLINDYFNTLLKTTPEKIFINEILISILKIIESIEDTINYVKSHKPSLVNSETLRKIITIRFFRVGSKIEDAWMESQVLTKFEKVYIKISLEKMNAVFNRIMPEYANDWNKHIEVIRSNHGANMDSKEQENIKRKLEKKESKALASQITPKEQLLNSVIKQFNHEKGVDTNMSIFYYLTTIEEVAHILYQLNRRMTDTDKKYVEQDKSNRLDTYSSDLELDGIKLKIAVASKSDFIPENIITFLKNRYMLLLKYRMIRDCPSEQLNNLGSLNPPEIYFEFPYIDMGAKFWVD